MTDRQAELRVHAGRIHHLTYPQLTAIKNRAVEAGLPADVAAVTGLLAADPGDMLHQLARPKTEVLGPDIVAKVITVDVLTAPLIRAPGCERMTAHRDAGRFRLPGYSTTPDGILQFRLDEHDLDGDEALSVYSEDLAQIDSEVRANNQHVRSIESHGILTGGLLFPARIAIAGQPQVAGWETADGYARTYVTQHAEDIEPEDVLAWLTRAPARNSDLYNHPLRLRRSDLHSLAHRTIRGHGITRAGARRLRHATMPQTTLVLSIEGDLPLDVVRCQVVSARHRELPTPYSDATAALVRQMVTRTSAADVA
jgi:hypothetical protein